jgi:ribose/xylose/arabinose/galactoside ABC-type transport system permease subunit
MIEIIVLIVLGRKLGDMAQERGRSKGWGALVLLWVLGELIGAVIGFAVTSDEVAPYLFALVGAGIGAGVAYLIVKNLSPLPGSLAAGGGEVYGHADPNNPYSPPGYGGGNQGGNPSGPF